MNHELFKDIAVFLDRDGTINEDKGYVNHPDKIEILKGVAQAIKKFNRLGLKVIVASNQSGIARGFFSEPTLKKINRRVTTLLKSKGAKIDAQYNCFHHPEGTVKKYASECRCRKPRPGMALEAKKKFGIDLKKSYMVGDKVSDIGFGHNFGGKSIYILTGYGLGDWQFKRKEILKSRPDYVAKDMSAAASWIINDIINGSRRL